MLLFMLLVIVESARIHSTKSSTKIFDIYKNNVDLLYMRESFNLDTCKTYSNRKQFVSMLIKNNIACRGHCYQSSYIYNSPNNYQAEHIIDLKNSILENCNKNIYGNLVMAYGKWNMEIGQLTWTDVEKEKRLVYGDIFDKAIENIKICDPGCVDHTQLPDYIITDIVLFIVFLITSIGFIIRKCFD